MRQLSATKRSRTRTVRASRAGRGTTSATSRKAIGPTSPSRAGAAPAGAPCTVARSPIVRPYHRATSTAPPMCCSPVVIQSAASRPPRIPS
jgi:hypothetical protein